MREPQRRDIHAEITAKIIQSVDANPGQPQMPWRRSGKPLWMPENALTKNRYNGINVIALWAAAEMRGFTSPAWATYKQYQAMDAQVRKGAKAEMVVFYKDYDVEPDPSNEDDNGKRRVARASYVFNAADVEGYVPPEPPQRLGPIERITAADRFITATGAKIEHGGERAYYRPSADHIQMPDEQLFCGTDTMGRDESYYAVLLHELTHWTAPEKRCNRDLSKRFLKAEVAAEELVAEIGSAFLCAELGITQDTRPDHAQYIHHWMDLLKDDPRAIFTAAAKASEAVAYLKTFSAEVAHAA